MTWHGTAPPNSLAEPDRLSNRGLGSLEASAAQLRSAAVETLASLGLSQLKPGTLGSELGLMSSGRDACIELVPGSGRDLVLLVSTATVVAVSATEGLIVARASSMPRVRWRSGAAAARLPSTCSGSA